MDLDSKGPGRLRRVANAVMWTSGAGNFTAWLAENRDVHSTGRSRRSTSAAGEGMLAA